MRVAQLLLPGAPLYERKMQQLDAAMLDATLVTSPRDAAGFDVAHVYAARELAPALVSGMPVPYVASGVIRKRRFTLRAPRMPFAVIAPVAADGFTVVPEAVPDAYFDLRHTQRNAQTHVVGSIARPALTNVIEQTMARMHRVRDDVEWQLFSDVPSAEELLSLDAWIDPAIAADDFDGGTAEALVIGLPVVASRTPVNTQRCEQGRTGFLVPPNDPNELVHAILAALFKPEAAGSKIAAARQTVSKFRSRQRLRALARMYENPSP